MSTSWWWRGHLTPVGPRFRGSDGEWTQAYRVHSWRPSYWRSVWYSEGSAFARVGRLIRGAWRYR